MNASKIFEFIDSLAFIFIGFLIGSMLAGGGLILIAPWLTAFGIVTVEYLRDRAIQLEQEWHWDELYRKVSDNENE